MASYSFVTTWRLRAPIEQVWAALRGPEFPWWPNMVRVRTLTPGQSGVGSRYERVTRGRLPYLLRYEITVTHMDPPREMVYDAAGDLAGKGRYVLTQVGDTTEVIFYWDVATTGRWMNLLAPLLRPLFAWNHNRVMAEGEKGLARYLQQQADATASPLSPVGRGVGGEGRGG
jgi:hypothetical protein